MAKIPKLKCPGCGELTELPDDPRISDLKETIKKHEITIERLVTKLEDIENAPPKPKKKKTETREVHHEGPIFTVVDTEEVEVDDDD